MAAPALAEHSAIDALMATALPLVQRRESEAAFALLVRCCGLAPDRADVWDALGLALAQAGNPVGALSAFVKAHSLTPAVLEYALHRAEAACDAGVAEAELACLEVASADDPLNGAHHAGRGLLLHRIGRNPEAIDALETASSLAPDVPRLVALLGSVLARALRLPAAAATLQHALELDPDNLDLCHDRAVVLMRMHRLAEARAELQKVRERGRADPLLLCNLANALLCLGLQDEALGVALEGMDRAPDAVLAHRAMVNTLPYHQDTRAAGLLTALSACAERLPRDPPPVWANTPEPNRPLRIGLLSELLKTHPVGWLTLAGFEALDRTAFSIVGLAETLPQDPLSRRFRAAAQEFHGVAGLDDRALAAKARELGIDVLIDLGGYGDLGRMTACAHRMAPVQIKWVGMQNHSTGLPEMDWLLTDRWETPPGFERFYSERLLRLPDGYVCYSPPAYAPDVAELPALAAGGVTFGCFTNLAKVTPRVIATWSAILWRTPGARLVLKSHPLIDESTAARVRGEFARHGVGGERIELRGPSQHRAFLAEYNEIDVALDPFPYSGGLTTCEALWMGVPVVTLPGETFASRHSASHLSNVGLQDWVAADLPSYVELAVERARNLADLAPVRHQLRPQMKISPLCDSPRFGRNLGQALRRAWREWCESSALADRNGRSPPRHIGRLVGA